MKTILTILLATISASTVNAEEFVLSDSHTGQEYGPFTYSNRAPVFVDNRTYTLTRIRTPATAIEEKMRQIIIPSIEFRQANIINVLMFLTEASIGAIEEPSVNILSLGLCVDAEGRPVTNAPPIGTLGNDQSEQQDETTSAPLITLNLRRVSLYDALSIVCEVADLAFRIDDRGVVFVTSQGKEIRSEELKDQQSAPPLRETRGGSREGEP